MADLQMQMMFRRDISAPLMVQTQVNLLMQGDSKANALVIDLYDGDQTADAGGYTVAGYLLRADGAKVPLEGSVSGNRVTAILNEHCYLVPGPYGAFVRLVKGEFKRTVLKIAGEIESEGDGPIVDVDEKFVTVEDVIEQMEAMIQVTEAAQNATAAANAAAASASTAAGRADTATSNANSAAQTAANAASAANAAAESVEGMTVSSEDVGPDTPASSDISTVDGKKNIHFKLRQGQPGATPDITFRVATGEPGTQVELQQSGTPEAPVIDLTIPRGDTGNVDGIDYFNGNPSALGAANPGTANGLARGDHVHPMPSASDVGALPSSGTAIDSAKLGGKDASLYALKTDIPDGYKLEEKVLWSGEANTGTTLNFSKNIRSYDFVTMKIGWQTSMPMMIANDTTFLNFNVIEHNETNGRIQVHVGRLSSIASDGLSAIIEYAATNFMYITNTSTNTSSAAVVRAVTGYRLAAK